MLYHSRKNPLLLKALSKERNFLRLEQSNELLLHLFLIDWLGVQCTFVIV